MTRQEMAELKQMFEHSKLPARDKRDYELLLGRLAYGRDSGHHMAPAFGLGMVICLSALCHNVPMKKLRKMIRRSDWSALLPNKDPYTFFRALVREGLPAREKSNFDAAERDIDMRTRGMACESGCWFCCANQKVIAVTVHEFESVWKAIGGTQVDAPLHPDACPALGSDGFCRAYEVRPQACRGYFSPDVDQCRRLLADPNGTDDGGSVMLVKPVYSPQAVLEAIEVGASVAFQRIELQSALRASLAGKSLDQAIEVGAQFYAKNRPSGGLQEAVFDANGMLTGGRVID